MTDKCLPNANNRYKLRETGSDDRKSEVRAYTFSPDCIAIQIRTEKGYATAILSDAQARTFAQYIIDAIEDH